MIDVLGRPDASPVGPETKTAAAWSDTGTSSLKERNLSLLQQTKVKQKDVSAPEDGCRINAVAHHECVSLSLDNKTDYLFSKGCKIPGRIERRALCEVSFVYQQIIHTKPFVQVEQWLDVLA